MRPTDNKSWTKGVGLIILAASAVFVIAIGVDGRFTNNQKVQCLTITNGICTAQVQTGIIFFNFPANSNKLCLLVPYAKPIPLSSNGVQMNVTYSFSQPHLGEMIFPVGELPIQGINGANTTDTFLVGGTAANPLLVPNLPTFFRFMPQTAWVGVDVAPFQISIFEYDNNATTAGVNPLGSLQIWAQWFPLIGTVFNGYVPQVGGQWKNLTRPMAPDNITTFPPAYPIGFASSTDLALTSAVNTQMAIRIVYVNNAIGAVPEKVLFSDMKISLYGTTVLYPNVIFPHSTNMNVCLVGAEANSFTPFAYKIDLTWTMTASCSYSIFDTTNKNYVQC